MNTSMNNEVKFYSVETSARERKYTCRLAALVLIVVIIFIIIFSVL